MSSRLPQETGPDLYAQFVGHDADNAAFFVRAERDGHYRFDLPGYVVGRARALDLACCENLGLDTAGDPDRFFSYRRGMLSGDADYGRQLAAIVLAD